MICDFNDMKFNHIRKAVISDVSRISEIYVFNNRMCYFPIFKNVDFSFGELQVITYSKILEDGLLDNVYVYDDDVIKGFVLIEKDEVRKLYVDYFFQSQGIGSSLLEYAVDVHKTNFLWTLKKNIKAIQFYKKHGFKETSETKILPGVGDHVEYLVKLCKE